MNKPQVVIIMPPGLVAESLESALGFHYEVVLLTEEEQAGPAGMVKAILRRNPEVVLVNVKLGKQVKMMREVILAGIAVIALTDTKDHPLWGECLFHGARTVLSKESSLVALMAAIRRIVEGQNVLLLEDRERLIAEFQLHNNLVTLRRNQLDLLSPHECFVLEALMMGRHAAQIAKDRTVSEATIRSQIKSILAKLEVSSQLAAVGIAYGAGWKSSLQSMSA
jgi:DNA-binding NarL/FixJ family response regulator